MSEQTKNEVAEMASDEMTAVDRAFLSGVATGLKAARNPGSVNEKGGDADETQ